MRAGWLTGWLWGLCAWACACPPWSPSIAVAQTPGTPGTSAPAAPAAPALSNPPAHYQHPPAPPPSPPPRWDWSEPAAAEPVAHRGFYTHVQLHLGLLSAGSASDGVVDTGGASLALGHSLLTPRLVAFLQFGVHGDQSPRRAGAFFADLGLGYHFGSPRMMLALLLGSANFAYTDVEGERVHATGGAGGLGFAYEWSLDHGPAAVGVATELRTALVEQRRLYSANIGLSFTYH